MPIWGTEKKTISHSSSNVVESHFIRSEEAAQAHLCSNYSESRQSCGSPVKFHFVSAVLAVVSSQSCMLSSISITN